MCFAYCNDAGTKMSWIDHILCSSIVSDLVLNIQVLHTYVTSDRKPLVVTLLNSFVRHDVFGLPYNDDSVTYAIYCPDWSKADYRNCSMYSNALDSALAEINIPAILLGDRVANNLSHFLIESYYNAVLSCITKRCADTIP